MNWLYMHKICIRNRFLARSLSLINMELPYLAKTLNEPYDDEPLVASLSSNWHQQPKH